MAYFDNAATTFPKPECVYDFMDGFYRRSGGNAGRGHYKQAESAGKLIDDTRTMVRTLLHCPVKQVIFEPTATISLNMIIQGSILCGAKNIYISPFEHNAVTRTLHHFEKRGDINVIQLSMDCNNLTYNMDKIRYQFDETKPDLVIVSLVSGEYNTNVFMFGDSDLRKLMADIQVEEQNHAEMLYKYKTANGMQ